MRGMIVYLTLGCPGLQRPYVAVQSITGCALIYSTIQSPEQKTAALGTSLLSCPGLAAHPVQLNMC